MRLPTLLAATAALPLATAAGPSELPVWARGGRLWAELSARNPLGNTTANAYVQQTDHFNPGAGVFSQRWYVDTTYFDASQGQAVIYIGGEGPLGGTPTGSVAAFAKSTGAVIVALEHRWYGGSVPPLDITSTDSLRTLSVTQAIADLAAFLPWVDAELSGGKPAPGAGLAFTWLAVGGSYPGALSSWFREKHPELVAASWSSSGVVQAVYNFTRFDEIVGEALGGECADAVRAVTAAFDAAWDEPSTRPALMKQFGVPDYATKGDMAWMLADSAAMG